MNVTPAQLDAAARAARTEFYGEDKPATDEWRWVVRAVLDTLGITDA